MAEHELLAKATWNQDDFETMGWHDARLYGVAAFPGSSEFALDLDYIVKWLNPVPPDNTFMFWISPVTLVFQDARDISLALPMLSQTVHVLDLVRTPLPNNQVGWSWALELDSGEISLKARGYIQHFRREPVLCRHQEIPEEERGGVSLARFSFDEPRIT